jgi:hypothetical protein
MNGSGLRLGSTCPTTLSVTQRISAGQGLYALHQCVAVVMQAWKRPALSSEPALLWACSARSKRNSGPDLRRYVWP